MRFYILSDLHLRKEVDGYKISNRIKKLCSKIRKSEEIGNNILFIVLGDIADRGAKLSFDTADENLSLIREELNDYCVEFEFVPGNHDLEGGSLSLFDQLILKYGSRHFYEGCPVYSSVHDNVNFIFADTTLSKDFKAPGRVDIGAIENNVKQGMINILFGHHAITHGHGSVHDTIEDSATLLNKLNSIGVSYYFHGHVHEANVTIPTDGLVEIGCGSLSGDTSFLISVFHQFAVGYIQHGQIAQVERWVDSSDGHGGFAVEQLYPKPKAFTDPDDIGKIQYPAVVSYIPRWVSSYEDAKQSYFLRILAKEKQICLKEAVQKDKKILLLCDAGMGKSTELKNLAHVMSKQYHTFYYSLEQYTGQNIEELFPAAYKNLPPNRLALLFDGYDELDSEFEKTFKKKLNQYAQDAVGVNIVISSRSNFCGNESDNKSKIFSDFYVYVLERVNSAEVEKYLDFKKIDKTKFYNCAQVSGVSDLLSNPFYLSRLSDIFLKENNLPQKKLLMDKLIAETFDEDELKFSGDLGERYIELFSSLERLALAMQLMHLKSFEDRTEYQTLFSYEERDLIKKSGLLKREGNDWKFLHNNFREYLAARCLSRLPKEFVIPFFYDGINIKTHWVNTLGYLTGFDTEWSLVDWLTESAPSALVKFEPDRLSAEVRIQIFKDIFEKYEQARLPLNDALFDTAELARFASSNDILSFLLERIDNPRHYTSQYMAVNLLRNSPTLFDKESIVRESLLKCCEQYPKTDKTVCRLAMVALCQLDLQTQEVTDRLMKTFENNDEDYIRLGMYEYLLETGECNNYVEYCLEGVKLISYRLNDDNRIGNESFSLRNCLKSMSTVDSVTRLIEWFSEEKHIFFYDASKVLESTICSATVLYKEGHTELFDSILKFYYKATRSWNTTVSDAMVKFFLETGTQYSAAILAAAEFEEQIHHMSALIHSDPMIIEALKTAYLDGSMKSKHAFHELVIWYVREEMKYLEYAKLIKETEGADLPAYKAPIDYDALNWRAVHEYFEILFDEEKRNSLFMQLLELINDPSLTCGQLLDADLNVEYRTALWNLWTAIYHYGADIKVSEFFDKINLDNFVLKSAAGILSEKSTITPTLEQKTRLMEIVAVYLQNRGFKNTVTYQENSIYLNPLTEDVLHLIMYLDYPIDENSLLDLTEVPTFIFDGNDEHAKYTFLSSQISNDKLKQRLILNVKTHQVKDMVLRDHIEFFDSCKDPALAEYAKEICENPDESYIRTTAWRYLYNTLGSEYIAAEILPIMDGEGLIEINGHCKDIARDKMREAMEREYRKKPLEQLQAHLITLGSDIAINDYVERVIEENGTPEGERIRVDGPTEAISAISNTVFLPQLELLLIMLFDPDFKDCSWRSLRSSLVNAFKNCGLWEYEQTVEVIMNCRPNADEDEENYRYCNYIIAEIDDARKLVFDSPRTLSQTKAVLEEIKRY